ncbi:protein tex [Phtheirospermum japonicum]|uniref:Protein tex n=1 Tax=Phtheirospermum japonicum TaxID=374723 RepID=A0A830D8G4_9LAMI|nr:protein tex [Phtheirospermum japonicum]
MPPVNNEELIPGATFKGKVRSIQPFGAFVDFGAFTDGLVHVSRLSDSFVKDVGNIVTVGQEVTVRLIEANMETGRISLSMRVTLTMKKEEDVEKLDAKLGQGVVHVATNPFVLAFRSSQAISAFLDEREKENEQVEEAIEEATKGTKDAVTSGTDDDTLSDALDKEENLESKEEAKENAVAEAIGKDEEQTEKDGEPLIAGELTDQTSVDIVEQFTENEADNVLGKDEDQSEKTESTDLSVTQNEEETASLDLEAKSAGN